MLGRRNRAQLELFVTGSLERLIPEDHILARVNRVLDLSWLREEVADCYCADNGRPGVDPEVAVRLMLSGLSAGVRARPSVDARSAGEPRDPVVHRVWAGGGVAGPFEPDADTAAVGRGAVPGDIPPHGSLVPGREGGEGRSGARGRLA